MIRIDGSFGEGGGQILRTSLSLSLVTGKPFRIENIRAGREKPGLLRQHLTAVRASAEIATAQIEEASLGSTALTFTPGPVQPGEYRFAVGTAGSGTLVLQTILPPLMLASGSSKVIIEGGTHNHAAPPFHYLEKVFLPLLAKMGPRVSTRLDCYGFYPAGGGRFAAEIQPVPRLEALHLGERGEITTRRVHAITANLPRHIAQREAETAAGMLTWGPESHVVETTRESPGPGNVVMIHIGSEQLTEMFTDFGKLGVSAETVAGNAAREAREYLASNAAAGEHLADQLLLPMALAGAGSFTALKVNMHARTNMEVISKFLPVRFVCQNADRHVKIAVEADR
ncbi:MAG: RNA 3'-terminal phosphate cyclase [Bryobacteraceae bacterium]